METVSIRRNKREKADILKRSRSCYDIGKTVFLTKEEAEAALRRMQDKGVH